MWSNQSNRLNPTRSRPASISLCGGPRSTAKLIFANKRWTAKSAIRNHQIRNAVGAPYRIELWQRCYGGPCVGSRGAVKSRFIIRLIVDESTWAKFSKHGPVFFRRQKAPVWLRWRNCGARGKSDPRNRSEKFINYSRKIYVYIYIIHIYSNGEHFASNLDVCVVNTLRAFQLKHLTMWYMCTVCVATSI